ncbi:MAG: DinB family protein [Planctomycetota bacterium]|nr:DinB family protein [Planctomycetota bacterium]
MSQFALSQPEPGEYAPGFDQYIQLALPLEIPAALTGQLTRLTTLLSGISAEEALVHHAPYTWSTHQVVGHITDTERVFGYRTLRLARADSTPLPGFDENAFMAAVDFNQIPLSQLVDEFVHLRRSHIALFQNIPAAAWQHMGTVSSHPISARAMAYALVGHAEHHLGILEKRLRG